VTKSEPPNVARWLSRTPDVVLYAILAGAIAWACHTTINLARVQNEVTSIREDVHALRQHVLGTYAGR
jgi:hypothetical protein